MDEMPDEEFDDTDMTAEEFEERFAAAAPVEVFASREEAEVFSVAIVVGESMNVGPVNAVAQPVVGDPQTFVFVDSAEQGLPAAS